MRLEKMRKRRVRLEPSVRKFAEQLNNRFRELKSGALQGCPNEEWILKAAVEWTLKEYRK